MSSQPENPTFVFTINDVSCTVEPTVIDGRVLYNAATVFRAFGNKNMDRQPCEYMRCKPTQLYILHCYKKAGYSCSFSDNFVYAAQKPLPKHITDPFVFAQSGKGTFMRKDIFLNYVQYINCELQSQVLNLSHSKANPVASTTTLNDLPDDWEFTFMPCTEGLGIMVNNHIKELPSLMRSAAVKRYIMQVCKRYERIFYTCSTSLADIEASLDYDDGELLPPGVVDPLVEVYGKGRIAMDINLFTYILMQLNPEIASALLSDEYSIGLRVESLSDLYLAQSWTGLTKTSSGSVRTSYNFTYLNFTNGMTCEMANFRVDATSEDCTLTKTPYEFK